MVSSNIILILLYLSPVYRTYYKAIIKLSTSVERGYYKALHTRTTASGDTIEATNTALIDITANQATVSVYANSIDFSGTYTQWGAPSVLYFRVG